MSGLKSSGEQLHNFIASRLELKVSDIWPFSDNMLRHFYLVKKNQFDEYKSIVDDPKNYTASLMRIKPDVVRECESLHVISRVTRNFYLLTNNMSQQEIGDYDVLHEIYNSSRQSKAHDVGSSIQISDGMKGADLDALAYFWRSKWWTDHLERTASLRKLSLQVPDHSEFIDQIKPIKSTVDKLSGFNPRVVSVGFAGQLPDFVPFSAEVSTSYKPAKEAEKMQEKYIPQEGDYFTFEGQQKIHQCINAGVLNRMSPTALCENIMDGERSLYYPDSGEISKANPNELSLQLHVKRFSTVAEEIERGNVSPEELVTATMSILESFAGEVVDRHKKQFAGSFTHALRDVADERNRQILKGYNYQNDDEYLPEILLQMGVSYAVSAIANHVGHKQRSLGTARRFWPFNHHSNFQTGKWFGRVQTGSKEQRTRLVKACALIMAEIEKMDRKEIK